MKARFGRTVSGGSHKWKHSSQTLIVRDIIADNLKMILASKDIKVLSRVAGARYVKGVLKPLELLQLREGEEVLIRAGARHGSAPKELPDEFMLEAWAFSNRLINDVLERYGFVPALIKRVVEKEKPEEIPSYTYGLLGVVLTE